MVSYLFALVLVCLTLLLIVLRKTYFYVPQRELKRQASSGDTFARRLWRVVSYGESLDVLLWILIGLSTAGSIVLFARVAPPVLGVLVVLLVVWVAFVWLPRAPLTGFGARLADYSTPALAWLLSWSAPALDRLTSLLGRLSRPYVHTGLFEREDLVDLLRRQKAQPDNRISDAEIALISSALQFDTLHVRDILVPRKKVVAVSPDDKISPVFLDGLHKSLHTRFPVIQDKKVVVGKLFLGDLTAVTHGKGAKGAAKDYMHRHVVYAHVDDTLADLLDIFYETKQQLFVVVDDQADYLGIVTLDDVLRRLLVPVGKPEFGFHDSMAAVAAKHAKKPPVVDAEIVIDEHGKAVEVPAAGDDAKKSPTSEG